MIVLWVALAGSAGAVARFVVDGAVRRRWPSRYPLGTLLVNVTGSLLLGLLTGLVLAHGRSHTLLTIAGTGFCGGYTTFSTACYETVRLARQHGTRAATVSLAAGTLLPVLAASLGLALTSA